MLHRLRHAGRLRRLADDVRSNQRIAATPDCPICAAELALLRRILASIETDKKPGPLPDEHRFLASVRARIIAADADRPRSPGWSSLMLRPTLAGAGFALALLVVATALHHAAPRRDPAPAMFAESMIIELDAGVEISAELDLDAILSDPELSADLKAV